MNNSDINDTILFGGLVGLVFSVILAPLFLFLYIMRLFFRAPLAAIFGSMICLAIGLFLWIFTASVAADMNPFAGFMFFLFMCCIAAGIAYGLRTYEFGAMAFRLECYVLKASILHLGIVGRGIYVFAQTVPGLVLTLLLTTLFLGPSEFASMTTADYMIWLVIFGWFCVSQFMVIQFHRTDHPIGQFLTFTGIPLEDAHQNNTMIEE